eukprot:jgi/Botrbrau1/15841/Bobra.40_1s0025.1
MISEAERRGDGKPLDLHGSCHCGAVTFTVASHTPYPYMHCYCSICRKTNGGGGSCINIMGDASTLEVSGTEHIQIYQVKGCKNGNLRHFCRVCGTHLYAWCPQYAPYVYPCASAIDTPLPEAPYRVHIMLASKASWVVVSLSPYGNTPPFAYMVPIWEYPHLHIWPPNGLKGSI